MNEVNNVLFDFFKDNLKRFFWMFVILVVAVLLWYWIEDKETPKVLLVGIGTYALTQFRGQLPNPKKEKENELA